MCRMDSSKVARESQYPLFYIIRLLWLWLWAENDIQFLLLRRGSKYDDTADDGVRTILSWWRVVSNTLDSERVDVADIDACAVRLLFKFTIHGDSRSFNTDIRYEETMLNYSLATSSSSSVCGINYTNKRKDNPCDLVSKIQIFYTAFKIRFHHPICGIGRGYKTWESI
jgi:hypothetical protein